jgi:hypothetical protein
MFGRDAVHAYFTGWNEMFPDLNVVPDEIVDAGALQVIVVWQ